MKKLLFLVRSTPHSGIQTQEKLDIILTAAAFDQHVALLFLDDGVFQLKKGQQAEKYELKETALIFNALEIYDVNELFVEIDSLQERGLKLDDLNLNVTALYRKDVNRFLKQHDILISG